MTACKWSGTDSPRVIPGRHAEHPHDSDDECRGCLPCTEPHCRVCGRGHADGTCAECLAETRANLHEIARLCDALPEEVEHRGIEGEAMMLLGPTADPEARGHLEASVKAGRVPADYLDSADSDKHPLFVLGTWDMVWRDALEHDEGGKLTIAGAVDYLDRQLSYMGGYEHVPFEDFARDLRDCVSHLEGVLHDGEQVEKGAPCLQCAENDERALPLLHVRDDRDKSGASDRWVCQRHGEHWWPEAGYRLRVAGDYRRNSDALTAKDIETEYGVKATSVRAWASKGEVRKRGKDGSGRQLYDVGDARKQHAGDECADSLDESA